MKILATPIEVLAYYEQSGKINPLRMKLNGETIKIYQHHLKVRAREKLSAFAPGAFFVFLWSRGWIKLVSRLWCVVYCMYTGLPMVSVVLQLNNDKTPLKA